LVRVFNASLTCVKGAFFVFYDLFNFNDFLLCNTIKCASLFAFNAWTANFFPSSNRLMSARLNRSMRLTATFIFAYSLKIETVLSTISIGFRSHRRFTAHITALLRPNLSQKFGREVSNWLFGPLIHLKRWNAWKQWVSTALLQITRT